MNTQTAERSSELQQFLQQVETALVKSAAEARRLAEQTGTKLIIRENFQENSAAAPCDQEEHSAE